MTDDRWADAECRKPGVDPVIFFPGPGRPAKEAKQMCQRCPLLEQCDEYVMDLEARLGESHRHGVYAGMSPRERRRQAKSRLGGG